jgi:hypothetical protein
MVEHYDVFFSHSHHDARIVEALAAVIEDKEGLTVWLDRWILVPGGEWQREMAHGLDRALTCAVFIGSATPQGWFSKEIQRALNRQARDPAFRVIPILLPGSDSALVDGFLELHTWVDFRPGIMDEIAMHLLLSGIRGVRPGRVRSDAATPPRDRDMDEATKKLQRLKVLRDASLVADEVALEFQRRIVDRVIEL